VPPLLTGIFVCWQVRELEGELEAEQRRHADAQKTIRRHERRIQEMTQISEDEDKARDAERETMEKLQSKMKQYKRELDDAVSDWAPRCNQEFIRGGGGSPVYILNFFHSLFLP